MAELRCVQGQQARSRHAASMFHAAVGRAGNHEDRIELVDFVALFFPHLPRPSVQRACDHYVEKPPPPPKTKTFEEKLGEVSGAREEIQQIFERLDGDKDGLVRMKSLEPLMVDLGITEQDLAGWMEDLQEDNVLQRKKSKLDAGDMQRLLGPVYIPSSPKCEDNVSAGKEIKQQIDFNQDVLLAV